MREGGDGVFVEVVVVVVWTSSDSGSGNDNGVSGRMITGGVGCSVYIPAWIKCCAADDDKGVRGSRSSSVCMDDVMVVWEGNQPNRVIDTWTATTRASDFASWLL